MDNTLRVSRNTHDRSVAITNLHNLDDDWYKAWRSYAETEETVYAFELYAAADDDSYLFYWNWRVNTDYSDWHFNEGEFEYICETAIPFRASPSDIRAAFEQVWLSLANSLNLTLA